MDYKQADRLEAVLARIADALDGIDSTPAGIEDALNEMKGGTHG